jgi:arachidonate 15-lipoxygenase
VSDYLSIYYGTDPNVQKAAIKADTELAAWVTELQSSNGGRLQGFGQTGGKIETFAYLVEAVTSIIFTASVQHAAVNFPQSNFSGYPPNMPAALYQPAPVDNQAEFQDWLDRLPPLNMAELQILVTNILTATVYGELGQYERGAFPDQRVKPILNAYKMALDKVDSTIEERIEKDRKNGVRLEYDYLRLENIPQSINI